MDRRKELKNLENESRVRSERGSHPSAHFSTYLEEDDAKKEKPAIRYALSFVRTQLLILLLVVTVVFLLVAPRHLAASSTPVATFVLGEPFVCRHSTCLS